VWKAILLTLLLIAAAGLAGLALPGGVVAAETTCSARKLELIGAACSRLLRHEARFVFSEEVPVATRRLERTRSQFATSWTQVEAEEPATCAAQSARRMSPAPPLRPLPRMLRIDSGCARGGG